MSCTVTGGGSRSSAVPARARALRRRSSARRLLAGLSETERLGVEALRLRASKPHLKAKANRPRQGEVWDMPGCAGAPAPPSRAGSSDSLGASAESRRRAGAAAPGTSDYLMGSVAVGIVIVNGPTAATKFTAAEQVKVVGRGPGWPRLAGGFNPWAGVSFVYDIRPVNITTQTTRCRVRQREPVP